MPMKLLKLPILILEEILKNLNIIELFELSQCSKKTTPFIKLANTERFKLKLDLHNNRIMVDGKLEIKVEETTYKGPEYTDFRNFGDSRQKICFYPNKNRMVTFWKDKHFGFVEVFAHVGSLFHCITESVVSNARVPGEVYLEIMKRIVSRKSEIKKLELKALLTHDSAKWILENLKVTETLEIREHYFQGSLENINFPFESITKSIYIQSASWLTLNHLKSMRKCASLEIAGCILNNKDMLEFFELWKSGEFPKLVYFDVQSPSLTENFTLQGHARLINVVGGWQRVELHGQERYIDRPVQIRRNDGVTARVRYYSTTKTLKLIVF